MLYSNVVFSVFLFVYFVLFLKWLMVSLCSSYPAVCFLWQFCNLSALNFIPLVIIKDEIALVGLIIVVRIIVCLSLDFLFS